MEQELARIEARRLFDELGVDVEVPEIVYEDGYPANICAVRNFMYGPTGAGDVGYLSRRP